jgi:putative transposase
VVAVVAEAYVNSVSTRKVERLVEQLGVESMSRSTVSRLCRVLDEQVQIFRTRPLAGRYPYLWLDARVEKVREAGSVRQKALVVAYGVHETGRREVLGTDVGEAESEAFSGGSSCARSSPAAFVGFFCVSSTLMWTSRRPSLRCSAVPGGIAPCTSSGTCRDMWARLSSRWWPPPICQVFPVEDPGQARLGLGDVVGRLEPTVPKVARLLEEAEEDLLAFRGFPPGH